MTYDDWKLMNGHEQEVEAEDREADFWCQMDEADRKYEEERLRAKGE
jgi:hypothetical protein